MANIPCVAVAALLTALVWFGVVVYQVYRDRYRTWTELLFLGMFTFGAVYALADAIFFSADSAREALGAARMGLTALTLAEVFFMLHGIVFHTRSRGVFLIAAVPAAVLLPFVNMTMVDGLVPLEGTGPPYIPMYDPFWFTLWVGWILANSTVALGAYYLTYREVRRHAPRPARRMRLMMTSLVLMVLLGGATNVVLGYGQVKVPPLFSTFLVIPGLIALYSATPAGSVGMMGAVRRWKARAYSVRAALLTFEDGTLIASRVRPEEGGMDEDLFGATLDVIQNFMRTSFPGLRGKWLQSITHGEYTLVLERAGRTCLTLVLRGRETDPLRRAMRDALLAFEVVNADALARWRGLADDARGAGDLLESFLGEDDEAG